MTNKTPALLIAAITAFLTVWNATAAETETNAPSSATDKIAELFGDPVIAKGDGIEIKRSDLDSAMLNIKSMAASRGQSIPPQQLEMLEQQMLARLIHVKLALKRATDDERATAKERADKRLQTLFTNVPSEQVFNAQLKAMGLTKDEFIARVTDDTVAEVVAEKDLGVTVSDEEAKKYYDEHSSQFEEPERVRASHILLATIDLNTRQPLTTEEKNAKRKKIEDILKRARAGEDFAELAREYSEDPGSKDKGGEYTFARGQMVPEFEAAAFTLGTNQISDVVTTPYGYHIIKVYEKFPARKVPYEEVEENLKQGLKQQAMVKKLPEYMAKMRKEAHVEILDESLVPKEMPSFGEEDDSATEAPKTNE